MIRRDFLRSTLIVALGFVAGLPQLSFGSLPYMSKPIAHGNFSPTMRYPRGGCTESGIVAFDRGPHGRDPFRLHL